MTTSPTPALRAASARRAWEAYGRPEFPEVAKGENPTALRNLLGAALEAEVLEELYILLEYQLGRGILRSPRFVDLVKEGIEGLIREAKATTDAEKLAAARVYLTHVVQLHRAIKEAR